MTFVRFSAETFARFPYIRGKTTTHNFPQPMTQKERKTNEHFFLIPLKSEQIGIIYYR